jgi:hypothetical protein
VTWSCIPVTHCDAQNAEQVKLMAFNGLPYADVIYILVFCCSQQAFNSGAKGLFAFNLSPLLLKTTFSSP